MERGNPTAIPDIAKEPTPLPINILSTMLYNALTNIPTIAGIENFNKSFPILSSPNCFDLSNQSPPNLKILLHNIFIV